MKRLMTADPTSIPGWKLKPGKTREVINNSQALFDRVSPKGITLAQFMGCITVGKTKLKEVLAATTLLKGKKLEAEMDGITTGIVDVKQDAPSLAKEEK
jgi:hypothetical protein